MTEIRRQDKKAALDALEVLLNILPKSENEIRHIAYTYGLICREAGILEEQATEYILSWSERLRALPNFKELYPLYKKPSFYRYNVSYAVKSAYKRKNDKPSSHRFKDITGQEAPAASIWAKPKPRPAYRKSPGPRKTT